MRAIVLITRGFKVNLRYVGASKHIGRAKIQTESKVYVDKHDMMFGGEL